ncbi:MAG TPA: lysoplasmalogenase, partial [Bacteroidales bacterium]|nr:lysoplasmalogenase [Bacteroidales bacterium]
MKSIKTVLFLTAAVISAAVFFYALQTNNALIGLISKPIPVIALALLLIPDQRYRQFIIAG